MYEHVASLVYDTPWAIQESKLNLIALFMARKQAGETIPEAEVQAAMAALPRGPKPAGGAVAVLPVYGTINQRMNLLSQMSGGTSTELLAAEFRQALNDPGVKAIVFDVDSPGGGVYGVAELAAEIQAARGRKPIVAVANSLMASAAYWLASATDDITVTPSSEVGSIGVFAIHQDISESMAAAGVRTTLVSAGKYKTEGNPFEPLGDEARGAMQARVNDYYEMFVGAVAKGRGVTPSDVRGGFGQGRVVGAREAVRLGMADRIGTLDSTLARFGVVSGDSRRALAASVEDDPEMVAMAGVDREVRERRLQLLERS